MSAAAAIPVFLDSPPKAEWLRGNLFQITNPTTGTVRIMEAAVVAQTIAALAFCYREYRTREGAEVVQFPKKKIAPAA